jgi:hypothetical protein
MTYRTGNHWGVTIVREAQQAPNGSHWHGGGPCEECPRQAELVAVVVNGDQALAERICALLNRDAGLEALVEQHLGVQVTPPADSCTCTIVGPHPDCPVHHGRRARGPKPPPVGPGCICDGSGRTCPRHGAVI